MLKQAYEEKSAQLQSASCTEAVGVENPSGNTSAAVESGDQFSNSGGGSAWALPYDK